jgi:hypothetical protein
MSVVQPQFEFYEKVRVDSLAKESVQVHGELGVVLGRVQNDDGLWYYTVHIYATDACWCFFEHELVSTGEVAKREEFFDGSSIRVHVDEHGEGREVPSED